MTALLAGCTVLVSGSGPGLGMEVGRAVLREGGSVALSDRSRVVHEIAATLDPTGERCASYEWDIADADGGEHVIDSVVNRFGGLDGLVNVAALDGATGGLLEGSLADWEEMSRTNVWGTLQVIRSSVAALRVGNGGSVVIIGAGAATTPDERFPMLTYAASKGALVTAAWHLACELGPLGVRVNTIHPVYKWGVTLEAALQRAALAENVPIEELVAAIESRLALGRMATDADVANAVVFFCSDLARSITGQTLYVDGGQVLH